MEGQIGTKNSFGFTIEMPFYAARFVPSLHLLSRKGRVCHLRYLSHTAAIRGEKEKKNCLFCMNEVPCFHRRRGYVWSSGWLAADVFQDTPDLHFHILAPAPVSQKPGHGSCSTSFHRWRSEGESTSCGERFSLLEVR
jgi:hypothetical protein